MAARSRRASQRQAATPVEGVRHFLATALPHVTASQDRPIFIFSAGWRSGSTLLQRLVCSDEKVLVWGEPYDRLSVIQKIAASLAPCGPDWPQAAYYERDIDLGDMSNRWIANLYPRPEAILLAHRALLETMFAAPAYALGAEHWGVKEVRFGHAEAVLLKGLFPKARFLFIRRDLEDAYLSYRSFNTRRDWYAAWPQGQAATAYSFARHWQRLNREFPKAAFETGGPLIDYSDLRRGAETIDALADYLGLSLDASVLDNRIGQSARRAGAKTSALERLQLRLGQRDGLSSTHTLRSDMP